MHDVAETNIHMTLERHAKLDDKQFGYEFHFTVMITHISTIKYHFSIEHNTNNMIN